MKRPRKKISNPRTVAPPLKPYYSNAVRVSSGPLLFIAGQLAIDKAGKVVAPDGMREALEKYLQLDPMGQYADAAKGMLQVIGATIDADYNKKGAPPKKK